MIEQCDEDKKGYIDIEMFSQMMASLSKWKLISVNHIIIKSGAFEIEVTRSLWDL